MERSNKSIEKVSAQSQNKEKQFKKNSQRRPSSKKGQTVRDVANELKDVVLHGTKGTIQDPAFYNKYPSLFEWVGRKAWNYVPGMGLRDIGEATNKADKESAFCYTTWYIPTIGKETRSSDPYNTISRAYWLALNRKYRGVGNYTQSNVGIVLFAIMDVFVSIAEAERIYGLLYKWKVSNRNIPAAILKSMNIDANSFGDLAQFRYDLNRLIIKARSLCLPAGFTALQRWIQMSSRVFKDSETPRAAMFQYAKSGYWLYSATELKGSSVKYCDFFAGSTPTASLYISKIEEQLNALLEDGDVAKICSDVLAAIAENNENSEKIVRLSTIPEDYFVEPEYEFSWLIQWHNTHCALRETPISGVNNATPEAMFFNQVAKDAMPSTPATVALRIYEVNDTIISQICSLAGSNFYDRTAHLPATPAATYTQKLGNYDFYYGDSSAGITNHPVMKGNVLIDTDKAQPAVEDIVELSRGIVVGEGKTELVTSPSTNMYYIEYEFSTEFMIGITMAYSFWDRTTNSVDTSSIIEDSFGTYVDLGAAHGFLALEARTHTDWYPLGYIVETAYGASAYATGGTLIDDLYTVFGDLDNPVVLTRDELRNTNYACRLSQFTIDWIKSVLAE